MIAQRRSCTVLSACLILFACLLGCGLGSQHGSLGSGVALHGSVHGGQQPVAGAALQLFAATTGSDGAAASSLLVRPVTTDAGGNFSITGDYSCPSPSTLVYLAATRGNPGLATGVQNAQLAELATLGACGNLSALTQVDVNELTTVAAVYGMVPYLTGVSSAGASAAHYPLLANGFAFSSELVDTASGQAPGSGAPAGTTVPVAEINTLGDIVASCVNSSGGVAGDQSPCGQFLGLTTISGSAAPTDTVAALINLANHPGLNTAALFQRVTPGAPFQPILTQTPLDFGIQLAVPFPMLSRVLPASAAAGGGPVQLDLQGSNFVSGSTVYWNSIALASQLISANEITATVPASLTAGSGVATVVVLTPGSGSSAPISFSVTAPAPTLSSLSTQAVATGQPASVVLTGSGFVQNSVAQWNGSARPTTFLSPTSLQVSLSTTDTSKDGTGQLNVTNAAPGGGTSAALPLTVTSYPIPSITGVALSVFSVAGCSQIEVTVTGSNLFSNFSSVVVNGQSLQTNIYGNSLVGFLPVGFAGTATNTTFQVSNDFGTKILSNISTASASSPPLLAVCVPAPGTAYPNSTFRLAFRASQWNATGTVQLQSLTLPAGMSTATAFPYPIASAGSAVYVSTSTIAAGKYSLPHSESLGSLSASGSVPVTVSSGNPPTFGLSAPFPNELAVPIGGSNSLSLSSYGAYGSDYTAALSIAGLPPGVTAVFTPAQIVPGDTFTLTVTAAANAPKSQNTQVQITATPTVAVAAPTVSLYMDVTPAPGTLAGSRTDFTSTSGDPYAGAYDPVHSLLFSSNPDWNRVDILSSTTHKVLKSVPVRAPRGLDISPDKTTVWVQTASQFLYAIDTTSLEARQYALPDHTFGSSGAPVSINVTDRALALNDGTVYLYFNDSGVGGGSQAGVFNPQTGKLNRLSPAPGYVSYWGIPVRSGDGAHVYASNYSSSTGVEAYDTATQATTLLGSGISFGQLTGANRDGSVFLANTFNNGYKLTAYNRSGAVLGTIPVTQSSGVGPLVGGPVYNAAGNLLYVVGGYDNISAVVTLDASSLQVLGVAPAMFTDPVGTSGYSGTTAPFAVDATGLVFGLQNYGIGFEDAAYTQNYAAPQPGFNGESEYIATFGGPLAGGTTFGLGGSNGLVPDVFFGQTRGTATTQVGGQASITSPPSSVPGPVNVTLDYPDGTQGFYPQLFSYSTNPQFAVTSGSSPNGGAAAQVIGYGLPQDVSAGSVTVGGVAATITTTTGQYPPLSGEPYPSTVLKYTFPQGRPGFADLQVSSPIGSGTLPKSIFYAKSVTDYPTSDPLTAVLFDSKRNQVYLAAGDHVDVFSVSGNRYLAPLYPAAQGTKKQFTGLALTLDASKLLVTDLLDGSLAVIDPDTPSSTFAIPVATPVGNGNPGCVIGPLYVTAAAGNQAFVVTGSVPAPSCPPAGITYIVNLQTQAITRPAAAAACHIGYSSSPFTDGFTVDSTADGNYVVIGPSDYSSTCLYSAQTAKYQSIALPNYNGTLGISISADGNIINSGRGLADTSTNLVGTTAEPIPLYGIDNAYGAPRQLLRPRLNASGSLLYRAYPGWFEVIDVAHATLRLRFALTETVSGTASPLAIDSGGRYVFLITTQGLTVVDMGEAPLSIGHLSVQTASAGTPILVRGSGFDAGLTAKVGGVPAMISVSDENTLQLTVPTLASGPQDVMLTRGDGATYVLESGVVVP